VVEKVVVLRGEDFPSLKATLPAVSRPEKKQKDGLSRKQKQVLSEELGNEQRDGRKVVFKHFLNAFSFYQLRI